MSEPAGARTGEARGARRRVALSVILLLAVLSLAELFGIALRSLDQGHPPLLSASTGRAGTVDQAFVVSGAVTTLPGCSDPAAFMPGVDRCLVYTVHNPGSAPITVISIAIASVDAPAVCPASNLDLERSAFAGVLTVPAGVTVTVPGVPIAMRNTAVNQDGCKDASFTFTFTGVARNGAGKP
jgi:hypothetical protein